MTHFDKIDTHEKAYWLGFLTADGGLLISGQYANGADLFSGVSCELAAKDLGHLEALANFFDRRDLIKSTRSQYRLRICSVQLAKRLIETYGWSRAKSQSVPFPDLPEDFISVFARGYFDGDGSFTWQHKKDSKLLRLQILGNEAFLINLSHHIKNAVGVDVPVVHSGQGIKRILYGGTKALAVRDWLYNTQGPFLERKKLKSYFFQGQVGE